MKEMNIVGYAVYVEMQLAGEFKTEQEAKDFAATKNGFVEVKPVVAV